jgi:hypothetical protein
MSLRNVKAQNQSRAARRKTVLQRATGPVVSATESKWETLENRLLMTLVHEYKFNEDVNVDPNAIVDSVTTGTPNNGVLENYAGDTPANDVPGVYRLTTGGVPGQGAYLHFEAVPGSNGDTFQNTGGRVDLDNDLKDDIGADASVVAWMRLTRDPAYAIGSDTVWRAPSIAGVEQAGAGEDGFFGSVGGTGTVALQRDDGAVARSPFSIADGSWHLVAFTRNSTTGQQTVYVDGKQVAQANGTTGPILSFFDSIGATVTVAGDKTTVQGYNYLNNADLDDVRLYNNVLTPAEVLALAPGGTATTAPAAPTSVNAVLDATPNTNLANITINAAGTTNESGFILERSIAGGAFTLIAQLGADATSYQDNLGANFNRSVVYRVRAFNAAGESANVSSAPMTSGSTIANSASAGYLNSNFWGATNRVWAADPDPNDPFVPGGGANDVGGIRLDPAAPTIVDPGDPSGIAVRNPDVITIDPLTQAGTLSRDWGTGSPDPAIRADNHTTIYTGKITIGDLDGDGVITPSTSGPVQFTGYTDDDGWAYVNGVLVSADPGGHGRQDPANRAPAMTLNEGQKVDFVVLQAEQGGGSGTGLKWNLNGAGFVLIPNTNVEAGPSIPQASTLTQNVAASSSHQVAFTITDTTTSEQRFELYRRVAGSGADFVKVNEVGINSPFINDASARPGTTYEYQLRGYNFASGLGLPSNTVTVTTAADPAPTAGLQAFYFNDDFWGQGDTVTPRARNDLAGRMANNYVGFGTDINSADVHEFAPVADDAHTVQRPSPGGHVISFDYGGDQHDWTVRPGGSPNIQIRDNAHSTVFTGKLVVTDPGEYKVMGFTDDDGYVIVDGVLVSSDPGGHGIRDPRPGTNPENLGNADNADRFVRPITLTAGAHDIVIMQSEGGGGSGVRLQWIRPGQTTVELVPETALSTETSVPTGGTPTIVEARGSNALINFGRTSGRSELKTVVEIASDAGFTQNRRVVVLGPGSEQFRLFGLTANTDYFIRATFKNFEGEATSTVTQFNSGGQGIAVAPSNLLGRFISPTQARFTWTDNAFDETGFVIQRKGPNDANFIDVGTVGPNVTTFTDTVDNAVYPIGTDIQYQVRAVNAGGVSAPAGPITTKVGGLYGGTGLRERIWDNIDLGNNTDNGPVPIGEPVDGEAPLVDQVDPIVDHGYGTGAPAANVGADSFAIEEVGEIVAEETKNYNFSIIGDDGVRLFLDDKLVIDGGWRNQGDTEYFSGNIPLTAGQHVKVRFQMFENGGGATARLRWNGPGNVREAIPTAFLLPTVSANDALAQVPLRDPTQATAFAMPGNPTTASANNIVVRWQDNAFGETGYDIQRATDAAFTAGVTDFTAEKGSDIYVDADAALDPATTYYYRVRTQGSTNWVTAGSAKLEDPNTFGMDLTIPSFNQQNATSNGFASITPSSVRLTEAQNDRSGSVFVNRAFNINTDFTATFDLRMSAGSGADGMAFIIQNNTPNVANAPTQIKALGGGGGSKGYAGGMPNSVGLLFDFYNNIDQIGVYTNGTNSGDGAANYVNDPAAWPLAPNGTIDLRAAPVSAQGGTGTIDLNNSVVYRVNFIYDLNDAGTPEDPADDTGTVTIEMRRADAAAGSAPLVRTQYAVNLAQTIGSNYAAMGFSAATGGANSQQEALNFAYDGPVPAITTAHITDLFVRGDAWSTSFKSYLAAKGLGDANYGYRLAANGAPVAGPAADPEQILPWINMNQVVLKYDVAPTGAGIPTVGQVLFTSQQGQTYSATAVAPVAGDPTAFVITLNQPLGGGVLATGTAPTAQQNGDRITVNVPGAGTGGNAFSLRMNVLQGDTDHTGENGTHSVLAADFSAVKKKFFKTTTDAVTGTDTDYSPFHDVNGSGDILANDFSEVKKRFFQQMPPPPPAAAGDLFSAKRVAEEVLV